jgi:hypothetical protein
MAGGTEAPRQSTALVAGPVPGRLWKNGRFQKKTKLVSKNHLEPQMNTDERR